MSFFAAMPSTYPQQEQHHQGSGGRHKQQLERLATIYHNNIFETAGPYDDALKLLLATCKTLVDASLWQQEKVNEVGTKIGTVTDLEGKINRADNAAALMEECSKRVSFLWAAQGLGDFSLQHSTTNNTGSAIAGGGGHQGATSFNVSRILESPPTSPAPPVPSPTPAHRHHTHLQQQRDVPPPATATEGPAIEPAGIGSALHNAMAVEDVLRKSMETKVLMQQQIQQTNQTREQKVVHDRLCAIEDGIETVYSAVLKAQANMTKLEQKVEDTAQLQRQTDHRLEATVGMIDSNAKDSREAHQKLNRDHQQLHRQFTDTKASFETIHRQLNTLSEGQRAMVAELADVRNTRPTYKDVKGMVAPLTYGGGAVAVPGRSGGGGEPATTVPFVEWVRSIETDMRNLYRLIDVPLQEAQELFSGGAGASVAEGGDSTRVRGTPKRRTQSPSASTSRRRGAHHDPLSTSPAATTTSGPHPAVRGQQILKLVHSGLPFKTILTATQKLSATVNEIGAHQEAMLRKVPPSSGAPLLGLELGDSPEGVRVVRLFQGLPAAKSGLQENDLIVALNGQSTPTREAFARCSTSLMYTAAAAPSTSSGGGAGARSTSVQTDRSCRTDRSGSVAAVGAGAHGGFPLHILRDGKLRELTLVLVPP